MSLAKGNIKLVPPTGVSVSDYGDLGGAVQNDGSVLISDPQLATALANLGWKMADATPATPQTPVILTLLSARGVVVAGAAATPSATLATYGTPVVISPPASFTKLSLSAIESDLTGMGSETVTVGLIANYSDTTASSELTQTHTGNENTIKKFADGDLDSLLASTKDIVSISVRIKSSISSSTASLVVKVRGICGA